MIGASSVGEWSVPAFVVGPGREGNATVELYVYPDIRLDEGVHEDALVYHVTESSVGASRRPPRATPTNTQDTSSYQHTTSEMPG